MDHNDLINALLSRRSIRRYRPDPVPRDLIEQVLTAAIWAPSAHNRQPWRFAVVSQEAAKVTLAAAMGARLRRDLEADGAPEDWIMKDTARSYERLTHAPVLVVVSLSMVAMDTYPDEQRRQREYLMAVQSTAMAGQNLLLAAHGLGLGACWMCAPLFAPNIVRGALALPDDWQPQGLITLGYPAETKDKLRHPLGESVLWR